MAETLVTVPEEDFLTLLMRRAGPIVCREARRFAREPDDREDLVQATLLDLLRTFRAGKFDERRGSLAAFAATRARSRAVDWWRRRQVEFRFFRIAPPEGFERLEGRAPRASEEAPALPRLRDPLERELLRLRYADGFSPREIGVRLALKPRQVSYLISKVRKRVRRMIVEKEE